MEEKLELAEGEEVTVIEDGETVTYINPPRPVVCKQHDFLDVGNNEQLCRKCGQGRVG
jgi:hypothetical protein